MLLKSKKIISLYLLLIPGICSALNFDEEYKAASSLYERRGESPSYALEAAKSFENLAKTLPENEFFHKSMALKEQAKSLFYYGEMLPNKDKNSKIEVHEKAYEVAKLGAKPLQLSLGKSKYNDEESNHLLAELYYWFGANLGKWGEAKGVMKSLSQWPTLRSYMEAIVKIGQEKVNGYGAHRIMGRAYSKLPAFAGGSMSKSQKMLEKANESTVELNKPYGISSYSINVLFYAETLKSNGHKDQAVKLLEVLVNEVGANEQTISDYNPSRVPETKTDIEQAQRLLKIWNK